MIEMTVCSSAAVTVFLTSVLLWSHIYYPEVWIQHMVCYLSYLTCVLNFFLQSLLGRVGETVRDILTPSFLKIKPDAKPVPASDTEWRASTDYAGSTASQQIEVEVRGELLWSF
jgi:hypothetical protein